MRVKPSGLQSCGNGTAIKPAYLQQGKVLWDAVGSVVLLDEVDGLFEKGQIGLQRVNENDVVAGVLKLTLHPFANAVAHSTFAHRSQDQKGFEWDGWHR